MNIENLQQKIFSLVVKITGHDVEDLEPDMYLEGDLGLDSIKMVELLNNFIQLVPKAKQAEVLQIVPMEQLMQIQTLAEMIEIAQTWITVQQTGESPLNFSSPQTATVLSSHPEANIAQEVPIIDSQYIFLAAHWAVSTCSLCSTLRLHGAFDTQVFQQSWQELLTRHPMLRAYFSIPTAASSFQDYRLMILDNLTPPSISITDLRECDRQTQESCINEEVNRCINAEWNLAEWPLHKFFVFRLADSVYEVFFTNHHIISDGLSNQIVLREFMEIYDARLNHKEPILPPPLTVQEYCEVAKNLNSWQNQQAETSLQTYLTKQGKNKFFWNPQSNSLSYTSARYRHVSHRLSSDVTNELLNRAREWRLPLNSLLVGAYLRAASQFAKLPESVILNTPTSGRVYPGVDIPQAIGCFAQNLALSFPVGRTLVNGDWHNLLHTIHSEIHKGLAENYDCAQTRLMGMWIRDKLALEDGKIPTTAANLFQMGVKSNLYLSNIGQTHIKSEYSSLKVLNYRAATATNFGTVDTLVEIFDNCLHVSSSYDDNFFSEAFINTFLQQLIAEIKEFVSLKIQPTVESQPQSTLPTDTRIKSILQQIATEICHGLISDEALDQDLEVDLGIDSLELIRIITKLEKHLGKVNRQVLLSCRSLREMICVLSQEQVPTTNQAPIFNLNTTVNQQPIEIPYLEIIEQVQRTPDAIAIIDNNIKLTYQELHRLSNQMANYLKTLGVKPGVLVGMMLNPGYQMWIAILGILKAGGAYVPLDPAYPNERIQYILEHAEVQTLLTEHRVNSKLAECLTAQLPLSTLVFLDEGEAFTDSKILTQVSKNSWSHSSEQTPPCVNTSLDLMTVLYTSGSTGRPKGVMLNHQGYMNRLNWMQKAFKLSPGERVAQKTSCCFDISVWEIFWPLMVGATACPVKREVVKNPWSLAQWINDIQINIMHFVPSLFGEFLAALEDESQTFPHLRWLVFSGEALPVSFIQRWLDKYGDNVGLANLYGPTEASIDVTAHIITGNVKEQTSIPIGKAIDNVNIILLNEQMQPVQPGELGELWIGGVQLAQGYMKNPEKTAQSFRPNPFADINSKYLYRTGDLAKQLPDGSFEYHGRVDHQVKIRGFRVELGEIENVLNSHPDVREVAVVAIDYDSGQKKLVAGVVGQQVESKQIKEYVGRWLPDYMIPHRIELLASLPKNHNGKLDRKAIAAILSGELQETTQKNSEDGEYLPLGPAQRWMMKYFEHPYQWTGYTRFFYHQPLELDVFNQVLNLLIEHHAILRTIFVEKQGQWQQKIIQPTAPSKAVVYDGSHLKAEKRDEQIRSLIQQTGEQLQLDQWPLLKAIIVKVNDSYYDIILVGHHLIVDLLSTNVIFNEFWLTYSQILGNTNVANLPTSPKSSYSDYIRLLMAKDQQEDLSSHIYYWLYQFPSEKSIFHIPFDYQKGDNIESSAAQKRFILPKSQSRILLTKAKQYYGSNLYYLLLAPLYRLLAEWSGKTGVVLSHRSHGRDLGDNHRFFESVGNFAVNFPMGIQVPEKIKWEQLVKQIKQQFEWLPMNGVSFDWLADQLPSYMYPDTNLTPVRANYLGNRTVPSSEVFEFIPEDWDRRLSPPQQKRTTLLEFFFTLVNGTLEVEIEYSSNFHLSTTIDQLGERYLELVSDLVAIVPVTSSIKENNDLQPRLNSNLQANLHNSLQELTA
ncbi:non-ribosomal peptide synthetase [Anabaena cylindrica FACHB-243]|uniref:Amino acid adenylation domain protein n=1 Tax=Anabaena cylindrica (strain ATCC 27899 / PCC 7122) TaxID=272123 RepID=K9ZC79_ANACC|nr:MULTISPECIES: non-ribosomal peptide synthetase [Anabaena]AFZ56828.1 amino acid adenylation domain protein [Anabaena cylindrica PCC 7122]MBD2418962.1 non-ribosomal peptide synthetase [Anabaena cylindrica FACHB-243]MBY5285104.1 non-ribosomal peptide synthetase [Anabaena sp. CCAP 1446/1C]MBY5308836.1 non-ribosomal peptide synthetase [Anabaena sp. CCAP 1446/1C]MCM2409505.1 non-ribosomal peptide synthetase [Anabaena sp. CCAP 1446/1C]